MGMIEEKKTQSDYGLPVVKRWRGKSLNTQLQLALNDLAALSRVKRKDTESYISELKAQSLRVKALNFMISRKETKKFEKLEAANAKLRSEVAELKAVNEKLSATLAAKPATVSTIADIENALANYTASRKQGGAQ